MRFALLPLALLAALPAAAQTTPPVPPTTSPVPAATNPVPSGTVVTPFGIDLGAPLPMRDAVLAPVDGNGQPLAAYGRGSGLVVVLWSNRCPWSERYDVRVADLARTYGDRFGVVLVSTGSVEDNRTRATEHEYAMPYLSDAGGTFVRALGAVRSPQAFVFGADGTLAYVGAIDDSPTDADRVTNPYLRNALDAIAAGQTPSVQKTEALGCLIR